MLVKINVKGVSNKEEKITKILYEYPDISMSLREFLIETVRITVKEYNKSVSFFRKGPDISDSGEVLKALSEKDISDKAVMGKISFGINYGGKKAKVEKAVENVIQCFEDGLIAVFADGDRYEELDMKVNLHEGSEVTFVRLSFLTGRMW